MTKRPTLLPFRHPEEVIQHLHDGQSGKDSEDRKSIRSLGWIVIQTQVSSTKISLSPGLREAVNGQIGSASGNNYSDLDTPGAGKVPRLRQNSPSFTPVYPTVRAENST